MSGLIQKYTNVSVKEHIVWFLVTHGLIILGKLYKSSKFKLLEFLV